MGNIGCCRRLRRKPYSDAWEREIVQYDRALTPWVTEESVQLLRATVCDTLSQGQEFRPVPFGTWFRDMRVSCCLWYTYHSMVIPRLSKHFPVPGYSDVHPIPAWNGPDTFHATPGRKRRVDAVMYVRSRLGLPMGLDLTESILRFGTQRQKCPVTVSSLLYDDEQHPAPQWTDPEGIVRVFLCVNNCRPWKRYWVPFILYGDTMVVGDPVTMYPRVHVASLPRSNTRTGVHVGKLTGAHPMALCDPNWTAGTGSSGVAFNEPCVLEAAARANQNVAGTREDVKASDDDTVTTQGEKRRVRVRRRERASPSRLPIN